MIQLDSLEEIAARGKASTTKLIYQKIMNRKTKAEELVEYEELKKENVGKGIGSRELQRRHTI